MALTRRQFYNLKLKELRDQFYQGGSDKEQFNNRLLHTLMETVIHLTQDDAPDNPDEKLLQEFTRFLVSEMPLTALSSMLVFSNGEKLESIIVKWIKVFLENRNRG